MAGLPPELQHYATTAWIFARSARYDAERDKLTKSVTTMRMRAPWCRTSDPARASGKPGRRHSPVVAYVLLAIEPAKKNGFMHGQVPPVARQHRERRFR